MKIQLTFAGADVKKNQQQRMSVAVMPHNIFFIFILIVQYAGTPGSRISLPPA